jgi:hypothetical protein
VIKLKISKYLVYSGIVLIALGFFIDSNMLYLTSSLNTSPKEETKENEDISNIAYNLNNVIDKNDINGVAQNIVRVEVYDGMTMTELSNKLNRSLKGVLANKGELIASKCIKYGMDPYVAVAIMLHETGCFHKCSYISTKYYNVGGMRGRKGYMHFSSIDEGINKFLDNLYKGYYKVGLDTPEKMNKKYAADLNWATHVNYHINQIKKK